MLDEVGRVGIEEFYIVWMGYLGGWEDYVVSMHDGCTLLDLWYKILSCDLSSSKLQETSSLEIVSLTVINQRGGSINGLYLRGGV